MPLPPPPPPPPPPRRTNPSRTTTTSSSRRRPERSRNVNNFRSALTSSVSFRNNFRHQHQNHNNNNNNHYQNHTPRVVTAIPSPPSRNNVQTIRFSPGAVHVEGRGGDDDNNDDDRGRRNRYNDCDDNDDCNNINHHSLHSHHHSITTMDDTIITTMDDTIITASDFDDSSSRGIQAFVPNQVLHATTVEVVREEEEEKENCRRLIFIWVGVLLLLVMIVVGITVPVVLIVNKSNDDGGNDSNDNITTVVGGDQEEGGEVVYEDSIALLYVPSQSPTSDRLSQVIQYVTSEMNISNTNNNNTNNNNTDIDLLLHHNNDDTPQAKAAYWIANIDQQNRSIDDHRFLQRYIAAVFYFSMGGDNWFDCRQGDRQCGHRDVKSFLSEYDECLWYGVRCDESNSVIERIIFGTTMGNNLIGTFPQELCHLHSLVGIYAPNNKIGGTIPPCLGKTQHDFKELFVSNNELTDPIPMSFLESVSSTLTEIHIGENRFVGSFPSEAFGKLTKLEILNISANGFWGGLDGIDFGAFHDLTTLDISKNLISGTLPITLGSTSKLSKINTCYNQMDGPIPSGLFNLTRMEDLKLCHNRYNGVLMLPNHHHEDEDDGDVRDSLFLGRDMNRRKFVWLNDNELGGSIPYGFGSVAKLRELKLHNNSFEGTIPHDICDIRGSTYSDLYVLSADCLEVNCTCCSSCFPDDFEEL